MNSQIYPKYGTLQEKATMIFISICGVFAIFTNPKPLTWVVVIENKF